MKRAGKLHGELRVPQLDARSAIALASHCAIALAAPAGSLKRLETGTVLALVSFYCLPNDEREQEADAVAGMCIALADAAVAS